MVVTAAQFSEGGPGRRKGWCGSLCGLRRAVGFLSSGLNLLHLNLCWRIMSLFLVMAIAARARGPCWVKW